MSWSCVSQLHSARGGLCMQAFLDEVLHLKFNRVKSINLLGSWTLGCRPPSQGVLTTWAPWAHLNFDYCCKIIRQQCESSLEHLSEESTYNAHCFLCLFPQTPVFIFCYSSASLKILSLAIFFFCLVFKLGGKNPSSCSSLENLGHVKGSGPERLRD